MTDQNEEENLDALLDTLLLDVDQSEDEQNMHINFDGEEPDADDTDGTEEKKNDLDDDSDSYMDGPDDPLECNKQLLSFWLQLKDHTTALLQKVECKLTAIETRMKCRSFSNKQVLFYTPGIPYFKDRSHFSPHPNEDEILKKSRGEIHIDMLPKVCPWTVGDRTGLLKLIKQEAITTVLQSQENVDSDVSTSRLKRSKKSNTKHKNNNSSLPTDFKDMVGALGTRKFDWSHIASIRFHNKHSALDCHVMWNVFLHPDINKTGWKKSEDAKLKEIAKKNKYQDWDKISEELGTSRSPYQCFIRYNSTKKAPEVRNCFWPPDEDNRLCQLIQAFRIGDFIQWREVAAFLDGRTKQQAYFRWTYSLSPNLTKGRFSKEEEKILLEGIKKYGTNFRKISADLMPTRSAVQLNDHYQRLQPDGVKQKNTWTKELDKKLLMLQARFGAKWSQIAQHFDGKSRTQLRHRYTALKKMKKKKALYAVQVYRESGECDDEDDATQVNEDNLRHPASESNSDDVDIKLIEYFRSQNCSNRSESPKEFYNAEELESGTQSLYNVLKLLNAVLDIPDNLDEWPFSERQKKLLVSLKEYNRVRNDKERQNKIMEQCATRMFASSSRSENKPDNVRKRKKRSNESLIDYTLNRNCRFVVDTGTELETPDCVNNLLKHEDKVKFAQLFRLVQSSYHDRPKRSLDKRCSTLCSDKDSENIAKCKTTNATTNKESEERGNFVPNLFMISKIYSDQSSIILPYEDKLTESSSEPTDIDPTFESLLGLKNLLYIKNLTQWLKENSGSLDVIDEGGNDSIEEIISNFESPESSEECRNAYGLLKKRMAQIFKFPLGLSKTQLPNVQDASM